jgi:hypothetical protein
MIVTTVSRYLFPVALLLMSTTVFAFDIKTYSATTGIGVVNGGNDTLIVLRKIVRPPDTFYLTVAPNTLTVSIYKSDTLSFTETPWESLSVRFATTPYIKARQHTEPGADTIQDAGFKRFHCSEDGIELTIDLCPSRRPLDRIVFTDLINEIDPAEQPLPVAVSITGRWMETHPDDLSWLKSLADSGKLSIVWINHTYNHYSNKKLPLKMNFIFEKGTDINAEILRTEKALLARGLMPSVFFRFPGLVSDRQVFEKILDFGLIPVGTDAWLAKGQWPKSGSIVLIHANGNEPLGVRDFIVLLKKEHTAVLEKKWKLFDLRKSVIENEGN